MSEKEAEQLWVATMPARLQRVRTLLETLPPALTPVEMRAIRRKITKSQSDRRRYETDPIYRAQKQAQAAAKRAKARESKAK